MNGALTLHRSVLWVGRHAKTAMIASYDLDGTPLESHFHFRDEEAGRSSVAGLAVDADHRVWVADQAAGKLRAFTPFGVEVACVGAGAGTGGERGEDRRGELGQPSDVLARGEDDDLVLCVSSAGRRRHALQELHPTSGAIRSLRPPQGPRDRFRDLCDLAWRGDELLACERGSGAVRVYSEGVHVGDLSLPLDWGADDEAWAVQPLRDGRTVLAVGGASSAVLLLARTGRVLKVLAAEGRDGGEVSGPEDVVVLEQGLDRDSRMVVLDECGERVQVFNLEGRCYGQLPELPRVVGGGS